MDLCARQVGGAGAAGLVKPTSGGGTYYRAGHIFRRILERMTGEEIDAVFRDLASDGVLEEVAAEARFEPRHPRLSGLLLKKAVFSTLG